MSTTAFAEDVTILVTKAGCISPFKSCTVIANDSFAQTIADFVAAGKTSSWHWFFMKEGLAQNATGQIFNANAQGSFADAQAFADALTAVIADYYAN